MEPVSVLVAEDNSLMREKLVESLSGRKGLRVVGAAGNGVEAVRMIREKLPKVMICDMVMPQMDGFGVLEEVSRMEEPWRPRVIALTALSRDDFITRAINLGASYYMVKPADTDFLVQQIMKLAGQRSMQDIATGDAPAEENTEQTVAGLLLRMGMPAHLSGYRFLLRAVMLVVERPEYLGHMTRELYPAVAGGCGTAASCVERSIRHAINTMWSRGGAKAFEHVLNRHSFTANDKPTNCELIALLSERIRLHEWA